LAQTWCSRKADFGERSTPEERAYNCDGQLLEDHKSRIQGKANQQFANWGSERANVSPKLAVDGKPSRIWSGWRMCNSYPAANRTVFVCIRKQLSLQRRDEVGKPLHRHDTG